LVVVHSYGIAGGVKCPNRYSEATISFPAAIPLRFLAFLGKTREVRFLKTDFGKRRGDRSKKRFTILPWHSGGKMPKKSNGSREAI